MTKKNLKKFNGEGKGNSPFWWGREFWNNLSDELKKHKFLKETKIPEV